MTAVRRFGHVPDHDADVEEDLRDRHVGALVGPSAGAMPAEVDYSGLLDRIPDQRSSNSCVGQAFATALYLRAQIAGSPIDRPSAKAIYDVARLVDSPGVLFDDGCRPRAALLGTQDYGLVAESRWPLSDVNVNDKPPLDVFRAGVGAVLSAYYRIGGADVATLIRIALGKGFVPVFAMDVDAAYETYAGDGVYGGLTGPVLGSHMQAVVGCGADHILVANSWGPRWGAAGFSRIAPTFFNSPAVRDVIVPTLIPTKVT